MVSIKHFLDLVKYNVKVIFNLNTICAFALVLITPVIFNLELLNYKDVAIIGEMYLVVVGILLLPYLALIEKNKNISDIVYCKQTNHTLVCCIRYTLAIILTLLLIVMILLLAKHQNSSFPLSEMWFGIVISATFFGFVGLTVANVTHNTIAGYLVAFSYFFLELFSGGKITGKLYALSLLRGSFSEKYYLLTITVFLLLFNSWWIKHEA